MAYCQRFINIRVNKSTIKGPFSAEEVHQAKITLIRLAQLELFPEEIHALSIGKIIGTRNKVSSLNPFLHKDNTLKVGGRLRHANFDFDKKHPMILAAKHPLTKLIFEDEHKRLLHLGPQALLLQIREKYWPIAGRNLTRQGGSMSQVFSDHKGRGCKTHKAYIYLFICLATKAIHLELVSDLTSENFILALRRFTARRGRPGKISPDNGTNFVGACSELKLLGEFLTSNEGELQNRLVSEGINWSFIPAYAPHFGGIWKSVTCRSKWKSNIGTLKVGDLVLVKDDSAPPLHWQLGRISKLHPSADSVTRAATIRTSKGVVRRAVVKLCPLPIETKSTNIGIEQSNDDKSHHN
ncbi:uncharacterized protein LOC105196885 [Solenopsis invicta]|uniref:uncharacterized protein LOC105196885 n=1 Tax=Solenopsis invicta TaxID=13686 RepID=UPI000595E45C|nr:uncharacterized protein LOC105196885 [Solenopsis invicta]